MPNAELNPKGEKPSSPSTSGEQSPPLAEQNLAISRSGPKRITAAVANIDVSNWPLGTYSIDYPVPVPDPSGFGASSNPNTNEVCETEWKVALVFGPDAASSEFRFGTKQVRYIGKFNSEHIIKALHIKPAQWQVDGSDVVFSGGGTQTLSDDQGDDPGPPRTKRPSRRSSTDLPITSGNLTRN